MTLVKYVPWFLLFLPLVVFAHGGVPVQTILGIFIIGPALFSAVHSVLILLLRWQQMFRYSWCVNISIVITIFSTLLFMLSAYMFGASLIDAVTGGNSELLDLHWYLLLFFFVIITNLLMIIWAFKIPKKQYQLLLNEKFETTSSIFEALGIKENKG